MSFMRTAPQVPVPWPALIGSVLVLWVLPVALGLAGLGLFVLVGGISTEAGLAMWFAANAVMMSPLFSWAGWLIALPPVALALWSGWFGWMAAALIGMVAGSVVGALAETEIALPFGLVSLLALRGVLGRLLPLTPEQS